MVFMSETTSAARGVPAIVDSYMTASGKNVIKFDGVETLRTSKSYRYLVIEVGYHPVRWNASKGEYVPADPKAYVRKGSDQWKYIEGYLRRHASRGWYWSPTFVVKSTATGYKLAK